MGQTTGFLTKSLTASAAILARRIVKFGAADGVGVQSAAATDLHVGISADIDTDIGQRASIHMVGNIAEVVYGGNVTRGDLLTSDASGRAISTTTAGNRVIGIAEVSGVLNDIGSCIIAPGRI